MTFLDSLKTPRVNTTASILQFPQIDIDGMLRKLRLLERAREQAERGLPAPESAGLDAAEQDVVYEIESEAKTQFDHYLAHQKTYSDRISDLGIESLLLEGSSAAADAIADFDKETHLGTGELYNRKRDVIETTRELERFRQRENLERPARNYDKRQQKYGVLLIILALEAVMNGTFLAKGSTFGFVGGIFEALIIAAINVVIAAGVGYWVLRFLAHKNIFLKIIAFAVGAAYLGASAYYNLGVAHYRETLSGDPFEAAKLAIQSLTADPLSISDGRSWLLFILGMVFSVVALFDGWLMDDPYPGYGQRMRHNLEALRAYNRTKTRLTDNLEGIKHSAESKMDRFVEAAQDRNAEYGNIVLRSRALTAAMDQHFSNLEQAANSLLRHYRDENLRHRGATPSPKRFDVLWSYGRPATAFPIGSDQARERLEKTITDLAEHIPTWREQLHRAYRSSLDQYKRIDDLVEVRPQ